MQDYRKTNVVIKPTLAIETSGSACGVCIYKDDKDYINMSLLRDRSHAAKLATLIESSLKNFDVTLRDIGRVAVSNGPGSFTGLRVGLSTAKGICAGAQIPLVLVPTAEVVAMEVSIAMSLDANFVVAAKVNTTEFYVTKFRKTSESYVVTDQTQVLPIEKIKEILFPGDILVAEKNWFDSEKYVNLLSPNPMLVAKWAAESGTEIDSNKIDFVEPYYFKEFIIKRK